MSEDLAKGLPTKKERIISEFDMGIYYLRIAFAHLKNSQDMAGEDFFGLNADLTRFSDEISWMLEGSEGKPGLRQILEEFKAKIKAGESK